jgi:NAD(P)-dependent dehydrogenase (short-subunit alcohol dehydrogenase family)/acyl carrier protein
LLIEVGPGETLKTLARQTLAGLPENLLLNSLPHPSKRQPEREYLLSALGRAWLAGTRVNWDTLHTQGRPRRLSLPSYPFESRSFWVKPLVSGIARPIAASTRAAMEDWGWLPSWQRSRPLQVSRSAQAVEQPQRWLVFTDTSAACSAVVAALQRRNIEIVSVTAADAFATLGSDEYAIAPDRREDYDRLLREVMLGGEIDCIAHLWNTPTDVGAHIELERGRRLGFYSVLYLAQALGEFSRTRLLPVLVASTDMQQVLSEPALRLEQSLLTGPILVMSQDIPRVRARSLDFASTDWSAEQGKKLSAALLAEANDDSTESLVAYRGGYRWILAMSPVELPAPAEQSVPLRERGVYLITGGTGGIGLAIARHLASSLSARLVLTSRSGLPAPERWDSILEDSTADAGLKQRLRTVRELEALGAEVLVAAADVADETQMTRVLEQARERFGALHGVVHAAGLPGLGILPLKKPDQVESVLRPKVEGVLLLDRLLAGANLDFMVLCSTINSVFGWSGTTDYSSANAFLDAFAHSGRARSTSRVLAINWGTWRQVGMAADLAAARGEHESENMRLAIAPAEGAEALRRALATPYAQLYVSPRPMPELLAEARMMLSHIRQADSVESVPGATAAPTATHHERPDLAAEYVAPRNAEEHELAAIWTELLGIEPIGINDNFFELGGHSLLATRVLARVQQAFKVRLAMRSIFDAPTIAGLAAHVQTAHWAMSAPAATQEDRSEELREEIEL